LNNAETKVLEYVRANMDSLRGKDLPQWTTIWLGKAMGPYWSDFVCPKDSATTGPVRLIDVSQKGGNFELLIEGQWKERVVLSRNFELLNFERAQ
jgi:hypothetical protein